MQLTKITEEDKAAELQKREQVTALSCSRWLYSIVATCPPVVLCHSFLSYSEWRGGVEMQALANARRLAATMSGLGVRKKSWQLHFFLLL